MNKLTYNIDLQLNSKIVPKRLYLEIQRSIKTHQIIKNVALTVGLGCFIPMGNAGETSFPSRQEIATNVIKIRAVIAADIDNDTDIDLITIRAPGSNGRVSWYENDGDGNFSTANDLINQLAYSYSLTTADFDGDLDIDIAAISSETGGPGANPPSSVFWIENTGGGGFANESLAVNSSGNDPYEYITSGDIDGDGDIDIAATYLFGAQDNLTDKITWFENDGSGEFSAHSLSVGDPNPRAIIIADINNDGRNDIVVAISGDPRIPQAGQNEIIWFKNNGNPNPTFTRGVIGNGSDVPSSCDPTLFPNPNFGIIHIAAAKVDNDNIIDIVSVADTCAGSAQDNLRWWKYVDDSNFTLQQSVTMFDSRPHHISLSDLDGDGFNDAVVAGRQNSLFWLKNDGSGQFNSLQELNVADNSNLEIWTTLADVNGDSKQDIIGAFEGSATLSWYQNSSDTIFSNDFESL